MEETRRASPSAAASGAAAQQRLSTEDIAKCKRAAQNEGVFAGLTSGFLGGIIGGRAFRFNRNQTVLCGILTGVLSGYFFTQAFLSSRLAEASTQQALLRGNLSLHDESGSAFEPEKPSSATRAAA